MVLILAKPTRKLVEWRFGLPYNDGDWVMVEAIEEIGTIDNLINYNNVISLSPNPEDNDWELQLDIEVYQSLDISKHDWIYISDSEFGGVVEDIERIDNVVKISGLNFRGYLTKNIITPPFFKGFSDYLRLRQEANELIWTLYQYDHSVVSSGDIHPNPYIIGSSESTHVSIDDKWRFENYLAAVTKSLSSNGLRLETKQIAVDYDDTSNNELSYPDYYKGTQAFIFQLSAKKIKDYSNEDLFSQDYDIKISAGSFSRDEREFLFCLGKGELFEREIAVLKNGYLTELGGHDTFGSLRNSAIFDFPNAESFEELIEAGKKRYFERYVKEEYIKMSVDDTKIEFFLGDIIAGEDFITGIKSKAEIVAKEMNISRGHKEISYKIGGQS